MMLSELSQPVVFIARPTVPDSWRWTWQVVKNALTERFGHLVLPIQMVYVNGD